MGTLADPPLAERPLNSWDIMRLRMRPRQRLNISKVVSAREYYRNKRRRTDRQRLNISKVVSARKWMISGVARVMPATTKYFEGRVGKNVGTAVRPVWGPATTEYFEGRVGRLFQVVSRKCRVGPMR